MRYLPRGVVYGALLIADALTVRGIRVEHIIGPGRTQAHRLTPFARVGGQRLTYPAPLEVELSPSPFDKIENEFASGSLGDARKKDN